MLHLEDERIRQLLLVGQTGLEKENLRVKMNGRFSHIKHPFSQDDKYITRDFCENQVEINTPPCNSAHEAVETLALFHSMIVKELSKLDEPEFLWPFSNPPYIENEDDIQVAVFEGKKAPATRYRHYLAQKYGKYIMTLSGIHYNYSFSEELLKRNFELDGKTIGSSLGFSLYKDQFYVDLAEKCVAFAWILTPLTAASPVGDLSYIEQGSSGDWFTGYASLRCSEQGYWNDFTPELDFSSKDSYADSIKRYVDEGRLASASELYYPVRLKPSGRNTLDSLKNGCIDHIELRTLDLNPLSKCGLEEKDVFFAQLLLTYLASLPKCQLSGKEQSMCTDNFKKAAHFEIENEQVYAPQKGMQPMKQAALDMLDNMEKFFEGFSDEIKDVILYQRKKIEDPTLRYAYIVKERFGHDFAKYGSKE